jgi:hypothetical protein
MRVNQPPPATARQPTTNYPSTRQPTTAPKRPDPCADDKPACPACGGLQCLCRPRFFPGQLLTDEDLNRLERYVIEKNKLHTRYLHGWGVACGLEVACDPCSTTNVVVRTGYAVSPCGDDIIVCKDHSVNVCELIEQCRPQTGVVCDPPSAQAPRDCRDNIEPWVLAICYDERPTRGITALTGSTDSACCSSCSCGGSGSCGCKGGASCSCGTKSAKATTKKKTYLPQCEPTQICEGYRFTAYPMPRQARTQIPSLDSRNNKDLLFAWMFANRAKFGPMLERLLCCITAALEMRESYSRGKEITGPQASSSYSDYLDALQAFASNFALHNCAFVDKLLLDTQQTTQQIKGLPTEKVTLDEKNFQIYSSAMGRLDQSVFDLIAECFCSALLPACPDPAPDNCVPLAVLTVRTRDCNVEEICNWEARKLLITWQTIWYWLSWLPWQSLRDTIAKLCCSGTRGSAILWPLILVIGRVLMQSQTSKERVAYSMQTKSANAAPEQRLNEAIVAPNLMQHLANGFDTLRGGGDAAAPEWASLFARLTDFSAFAPLAGTAAVEKTQIEDLKNQIGIEALTKQVEDLKAQVAGHEEQVTGLRNFIMNRKGA